MTTHAEDGETVAQSSSLDLARVIGEEVLRAIETDTPFFVTQGIAGRIVAGLIPISLEDLQETSLWERPDIQKAVTEAQERSTAFEF